MDTTQSEKDNEKVIQQDEQATNPKYVMYRRVKTVYLLVVYMGFGFACSIGGPSIPDLVNRLCVTFSQFSISSSLGALGSLCGALAFGFICDRFQKKSDLILTITLTVIGTCLLLKPFTPYLWLFIIWGIFEASCYAGMDTAANSMMFGLWGEKANGPAHALHLVWGIGFTTGPFVVRPFLGSDDVEDEWGNATTVPDFGNTTCFDDSRIEIPFAIAATICYILAITAFVFFWIGPPKGMNLFARPVKTLKDVVNLEEIGGGDKKFAVTFLILFALFYFGNAGREHVFNTWLFTYAVESDLDFSKSEAALLDAANKGVFMLGRIFAIPISHWLPIQPVLFVEVYTVMAIVTCLATLGTKEKVYLWTFSCLMNFFSSPIWPGGLSWTDKYIPVTAIVVTVMTVGAASAGFFFQWFTGWLFDNTSPDDVMYVLVSCSALLCAMLVIMQIIASKHGNRFDNERKKELEKAALGEKQGFPPSYTEAISSYSFDNEGFSNTYL